jgi:predicted ATPase
MKIVSIKIKNYRAFESLEIKDIPAFCVIIGANKQGKQKQRSALFAMN